MKNIQDLSILLVEDNPVDIDLTLHAFSRIHFNNPVQVARDGLEVIELFEHWKEDTPYPGVILLDIKLPKVTGLEVLKKLKTNPKTCAIPVVMLTSSTDETDVKTAYQCGANSYIIKPVDFEKFTLFTSTLCEYWMNLNVRPEPPK
jgi:CheY-like chemotaxis protein